MAIKKTAKKNSDNKRYALLSVSDKKGIVEFAKELTELGFEIISTGGTAKVLAENKIPVIPIQKITGNPECFDGRMKTISFEIESGILYDRQKKSHVKEAKELNIKPIDIVVCNLYPFEKAVSKKV
jgi:phosphoribosylaminoimidazolecarboxamide formyltransferase/IMP cyclohydrolase